MWDWESWTVLQGGQGALPPSRGPFLFSQGAGLAGQAAFRRGSGLALAEMQPQRPEGFMGRIGPPCFGIAATFRKAAEGRFEKHCRGGLMDPQMPREDLSAEE